MFVAAYYCSRSCTLSSPYVLYERCSLAVAVPKYYILVYEVGDVERADVECDKIGYYLR